jgi:hypothetical protein
LGGGNVNDKCDGQVVRYGEVSAGDIVDVEANGANQVQDVSTVVGGKVDVLCEAEAVDKVQKVHGIFTVRGVNV